MFPGSQVVQLVPEVARRLGDDDVEVSVETGNTEREFAHRRAKGSCSKAVEKVGEVGNLGGIHDICRDFRGGLSEHVTAWRNRTRKLVVPASRENREDEVAYARHDDGSLPLTQRGTTGPARHATPIQPRVPRTPR